MLSRVSKRQDTKNQTKKLASAIKMSNGTQEVSVKKDAALFRNRGKEVVEYIANYFETVDQWKPFPDVEPGYLYNKLPDHAPEQAEEWEDVMEDVKKIIMPGITHWHHPRFNAYYVTANSFPGILGEMMMSGLGCNGFTWACGPAVTELEILMMDWLGKMLNLPSCFLSSSKTGGGIIQGTCSEATLMALFAARNKTISEVQRKNPQMSPNDILTKLVGYHSAQAHASAPKAGLLSMIRLKPIKCNTRDHGMSPEALEEEMQKDIKDGYIPFYCIATLGTTASCAFDPLDKIGPLCSKYNVWCHVDAAYAGAAFICPEHRSWLNGVEHCMSFVFNAHKWLLTNFDCSTIWYKETKYVSEPFEIKPNYHQKVRENAQPDFRHWQVPWGRRFRALKLWFVIRLYGIEGLQAYIRRHVDLAHYFEELLLKDGRFEIVQETVLGLICFRIKNDNNRTTKLFTDIDNDGRIHLIPSQFGDTNVYYIRMAINYEYTTRDNMDFAYSVIKELTDKI